MNNTIRELFERKSVRVFDEKEISEEDKRMILEAATMAPSAGNQQLYTILDITDQDLKDKLVVTCDNQPFIATAKQTVRNGMMGLKKQDVDRDFQGSETLF